MERTLIDICFLVGGFLLLAYSADWLVRGSSEVACRLGVRPLLLGLTVVAWGTSAPELVVSSLAAAEGKAGISLGNVLGSNVANIGLVLGVCSLILPAVMKPLERREAFWLLAPLALLWWCIADGELARVEGVLLLGTFAVYNVHLYWSARRGVECADQPVRTQHPWREVVLGIVGVALGARLIVSGGESLATAAGVSQRVIGLSIVAVGTSLPELAAGIGSSIRRQADISLGNVVGSNVFNVLAVLGVAALIRPLGAADGSSAGEALHHAGRVDLPIVLGFTVAVFALPWLSTGRGGRWKGALLLASYLAYMAFLFVGRG